MQMQTEIDFLSAAANHAGLDKSFVDSITKDFDALCKVVKNMEKMETSANKVVLRAVLSKYIESKNKLDQMVSNPTLYVKRELERIEISSKIRDAVNLHPNGKDTVLSALPFLEDVC